MQLLHNSGWLAPSIVFVSFALSTLLALSSIWKSDPDYSHGLLVLCFSGFLLWRERESLARVEGGNHWGGSLLVGVGLVSVIFGCWYDIALRPAYFGHVFLRAMGLVSILLGSGWLLWGWCRARAMLAPIAYLVFAIPLPESFTLPLTLLLRQLVSFLTTEILRAVGVVVHRDGNILELASGALGVDDACSGIRSLWVLTAAAVGLALFYRARARRALALLLLALPLAVGCNLARTTSSALLAEWGHSAWLYGARHDALGFIAVLVAASVLLWISQRWQASESEEATKCAVRPAVETTSWSVPALRSFLLTCLLLSALGAQIFISRHYSHRLSMRKMVPIEREALATFPARVGNFHRVHDRPMTAQEAETLQPADFRAMVYENDAGLIVHVVLLYWHPERVVPKSRYESSYPHSPEMCYPVAGWRKREKSVEQLNPDWLGGRSARSMLFERADRSHYVVYWQDFGEPEGRTFVPEALRQRLSALLSSWQEDPHAIIGSRHAVTVAVELGSDVPHARSAALSFSQKLAQLLPAYGFGEAPPVHAK